MHKFLTMRFLPNLLGIFLISIVWCLKLFANYTLTRSVWYNTLIYFEQDSFQFRCFFALFVLYQILFLLSISSHIQCCFTNPGILKDITTPKNFENPKYCQKCELIWKPPRSHHCSTCQRCVFRMDHHCPWINNCVGLYNQKLFILFLTYSGLFSLSHVLLLCAWFILRFFQPYPPAVRGIDWMCIVFSVALALPCLFLSFQFLTEQWEAIQTNSTLVENYQGTVGQKLSFKKSLEGVFGLNKIWWPIPLSPHLNADFAEPVFPEQNGSRQLEESSSSKKYE